MLDSGVQPHSSTMTVWTTRGSSGRCSCQSRINLPVLATVQRTILALPSTSACTSSAICTAINENSTAILPHHLQSRAGTLYLDRTNAAHACAVKQDIVQCAVKSNACVRQTDTDRHPHTHTHIYLRARACVRSPRECCPSKHARVARLQHNVLDTYPRPKRTASSEHRGLLCQELPSDFEFSCLHPRSNLGGFRD